MSCCSCFFRRKKNVVFRQPNEISSVSMEKTFNQQDAEMGTRYSVNKGDIWKNMKTNGKHEILATTDLHVVRNSETYILQCAICKIDDCDNLCITLVTDFSNTLLFTKAHFIHKDDEILPNPTEKNENEEDDGWHLTNLKCE